MEGQETLQKALLLLKISETHYLCRRLRKEVEKGVVKIFQL